ncbi:MAG: hypothetical protein AAGA66_08290 [Bacteroidota bacterium]
MRLITILIFSTSFYFSAYAQGHRVGVKAGIVDVDLVGDIGHNLELYYENEVVNGLFYGFNFGIAAHNTFPKEFEPVNMHINGVPPAIDQEILNLNFSDAFLYGYQRTSVDYLQFVLKYRPPFNILGHFFYVQTGLMISQYEATLFTLDSWQFENGRMASYDTYYGINKNTQTGWLLGLGIERNISPDYVLSVDAKYNLQFSYERLESPLGLLRLGVARKF